MTIKGEFLPLSLLIPSLDSPQKLYFLYRKAAETGSRGAQLRFQWFKQSLSDELLDRLEVLFASPKSHRKSA